MGAGEDAGDLWLTPAAPTVVVCRSVTGYHPEQDRGPFRPSLVAVWAAAWFRVAWKSLWGRVWGKGSC